nr:cytosolic thymidine kinase-like protein [Wadden Sea poxvirus]
MNGEIQLILGPMFSGKSTELIRRIRRYQIAKYTCIVIKYYKDIRYGKDDVITHDNLSINAISVSKLEEIDKKKINVNIIGIDEGQFFTDIVSFCEKMANDGKIIIVAALDGTFQRKAFGNILNLIPLSENVVKLTAICMKCFNIASFSKRLSDEKDIEVIGEKEKYQSVCRKCYFL